MWMSQFLLEHGVVHIWKNRVRGETVDYSKFVQPWYSPPEVNEQVLCSSSGQLGLELASGDCILFYGKKKTKT